MRVKFGFVLPTWDWSTRPRQSNVGGGRPVDYAVIRQLTLTAENLGFHSVFSNDHIVRGEGGYILEGWTVISALSSLTKKIRLGNLVLCNAFRYPQLLAKMAATLDVICSGRLELGIGSGWLEDEFLRYGIPFHTPLYRSSPLSEALNVIKMLWTHDRTDFHGQYYQLKDAICEPKPIQKPHPPILIGGGGEQLTLRIVAESGDICNFGGSPEVYLRKLNVLRKHCEIMGRQYDTIEKSWTGDFIISTTDEGIFQKMREIKPANSTLEQYIEHNIVGSPEQCLAKIKEYMDLGVT